MAKSRLSRPTASRSEAKNRTVTTVAAALLTTGAAKCRIFRRTCRRDRCFSMVMPRSLAFSMSYTVSAATLTAVSASISTPVRPVTRHRLVTASVESPAAANSTATLASGSGWQRGYQVTRAFGGLDARNASHRQHIALRRRPVQNRLQARRRHADPGLGPGPAGWSKPSPKRPTIDASPRSFRWVRGTMPRE